jgi:hypothetical protein
VTATTPPPIARFQLAATSLLDYTRSMAGRALIAFALAAATLLAPDTGRATIVLAVDTANNLLRFDAASPGNIDSTLPITGLVAGDQIVAIAIRPATGDLYGLGVNGAMARLYVINNLAVATQLGGTIALPQAVGAAVGTAWGFAFNPTVDRIRVVNDGRDNFRLNPNNGAVAGVDTALSASARVIGAAYDRNLPGLPATTLFGIDSNSDRLVRQGGVDGNPSPNGGVITPIGALGLNASDLVGFDIQGNALALAALNVGGTAGLYSVNLATGLATLIGTVGDGTTSIVGIALGLVPFEAPALSRLALGMAVLLLAAIAFAALLRRRAASRASG